ncbi:DUF362 domain-containing protein [Candidatus Poribacteria bacterium]|nr:DUF362 domain-containing protein [Candidatus Poribacteria bacterium]
MKPQDTVIANIIADSLVGRVEQSETRHAIQTVQKCDTLNRRQFLNRLGTISGVALSALPAFAQIGGGRVLTPPTETAALPPVVEVIGKQVWEEDRLNEDAVGEMVDRAMMKLTGRDTAKEAWRDFVLPDDIVGIKINPLAGPKLSTHAVIVNKIIEGLFSAGVLRKQVIIWDRFEAHLLNAGYPIKTDDGDVRTLASDMDDIGYDDEVFYETEQDSIARRENESTRSRYSRIVTERVDVLINVPVLKHHDMAGISGCLKNMAFGSVDNTRRFHGRPLYCNPAIGEIFENKVLKEKVVLNIVDGLVASYDNGPTYHAESTWQYGGLFVSADPVILDTLILQTVNQKREEIGLNSMSKYANHITAASGLGLGSNSLDQVNLQKIEV